MAPPKDYASLIQQTFFPGMTFVESAVMREWIFRHGAEYDSIEFNVRLGKGAELGPEFDEPTRRLAFQVSPRRADAICTIRRSITIVEAKVNVSLGALGQLIGYRELWLADHPETVDVKLVAIGRRLMNDAEPAFRQQGIDVELFPRAAEGRED